MARKKAGAASASGGFERLVLMPWHYAFGAMMVLRFMLAVLEMLSGIKGLAFLGNTAQVLYQNKTLAGAAIGLAVSASMNRDLFFDITGVLAGAAGAYAGGNLTAMLAVWAAGFAMDLVQGKTKADMLLMPLIGGTAAALITGLAAKVILKAEAGLSGLLAKCAALPDPWMGLSVGALSGAVSLLPFDMYTVLNGAGFDNLASGAALAGIAAHMAAFAVSALRDQDTSSALVTAFGSGGLQSANTLRRPLLWLGPLTASCVSGALSSAVFGVRCSVFSASMGLTGGYAFFALWRDFHGRDDGWLVLTMAVLYLIVPAAAGLIFNRVLTALGKQRKGDLRVVASAD